MKEPSKQIINKILPICILLLFGWATAAETPDTNFSNADSTPRKFEPSRWHIVEQPTTIFCQVDGPSFLALTSPAATIAIFFCGLEFIFGWVDAPLIFKECSIY